MGNGIYRLGWGVAAVFALLFAASMAGIVQGGALDPPGAPASTMKSLDDIPGSWSRQLSATGGCDSPRFDCVFGDLAVLDRETGLVWERTPAATTGNWSNAMETCSELAVNGRLGWRLPTMAEVNSLLVLDAVDDLPDGHPFTLTPGLVYWSSTTVPPGATTAWGYAIGQNGAVTNFAQTITTPSHWCVRGGQGGAGQ